MNNIKNVSTNDTRTAASFIQRLINLDKDIINIKSIILCLKYSHRNYKYKLLYGHLERNLKKVGFEIYPATKAIILVKNFRETSKIPTEIIEQSIEKVGDSLEEMHLEYPQDKLPSEDTLKELLGQEKIPYQEVLERHEQGIFISLCSTFLMTTTEKPNSIIIRRKDSYKYEGPLGGFVNLEVLSDL